MKKIITILTFVLLSITGFTQTRQLTNIPKDLPPIGTYQFVIGNERVAVNITEDILKMIELKRLETTTTYIEVDEYTKVKILSLEYILSENFEPLKLYSYE